MPYIKKEDRDKYEHATAVIAAILAGIPSDRLGGELNFVIYSIVKKYFNLSEMKYAKINTIMGALECSRLEVYRRLAAEYEDGAIDRNGDVD